MDQFPKNLRVDGGRLRERFEMREREIVRERNERGMRERGE